jgi:isopenicillin-N epimerase
LIGAPPVAGSPLSTARPVGARSAWQLDPDVVHLNHGSFGAVPREVAAAQSAWRRRLERNPNGFIRYELPALLGDVRTVLAGFLGVEADGLALLPNATYGVASVLRSLPPSAGTQIVVLGEAYPSVATAVALSARTQGLDVVDVAMPRGEDPALVAEVLDRALDRPTRLVVVDQIASLSCALAPTETVAAVCRRRGVPLLVDGAHAPGPLEAPVAGLADFWVGNLHKWMCAPRGSAVLWVGATWRHTVRPAVPAYTREDGLAESFAWTGTFDPSAWLAIPDAIAFVDRLGGRRLWERNARLAGLWRDELLSGWQTADVAPPRADIPMVSVPATPDIADTEERLADLIARLSARDRIEVVAFWRDGRPWFRLSAHAYNRVSDAERLLAAVR